ncbi:hypothetical protein [Abyssalbus ytuae]|uniref:Uncharacterized protein n=1 Tax=Abyssalbus ytuae TaxID=2926907 RepID=A0A9E6ZSL3_9FLAO|nr:hypothetical protein [Abyssalbus ytuae]UOB18093.1 hypothetical protein MQE35_02050 [Abyssalbus ytuae]
MPKNTNQEKPLTEVEKKEMKDLLNNRIGFLEGLKKFIALKLSEPDIKQGIKNGKLVKEKGVKAGPNSAKEEGILYTRLNEGSYLITISSDSPFYKELKGLVDKEEKGQEIKLEEMSPGLQKILSTSVEGIEKKIQENQQRKNKQKRRGNVNFDKFSEPGNKNEGPTQRTENTRDSKKQEKHNNASPGKRNGR